MSASKRFQFVSNNIRVQLSLDVDEREPMPMYLTKTTTEYYNILQNSPEIKDTILNNFKSENDLIEINNLIQDYSNPVSYATLCENNVFNTHMYYDILQDKITELIMILDYIHNTNKTFKYSIEIKYTNKKNPIRIKINNRGQKILTLSARKVQSL